MSIPRAYSKVAQEAAILLGKQIRLNRKQRRWSEHNLAERAGISRATLQKIEQGDMGCAVGLVFEVAVLVGVPLFTSAQASLAGQIERAQDKIALLPARIVDMNRQVDDDF